MITIANDQLIATINLKGAELTSLVSQKTKSEYMWRADPVFWGRHAPILFPIVGRLKNDEYIYDGLTYSMSQHGFARDMDFNLVRQEASYAAFSMISRPQTLMVYPFKFELIVIYELVEKSVRVTYQVFNKDHKEIFFSIGGHPAFNCPIGKGKRSDYQLIFDKEETAHTLLLTDGLRNDSSSLALNKSTSLPIVDNLFDQDALIFENLNSSAVSLQKGNKKVLTLSFEGFPYLGIWSKNRESPFICIEPWYGIADSQSSDHDFIKKEGLIYLNLGDEFRCQYQISIH